MLGRFPLVLLCGCGMLFFAGCGPHVAEVNDLVSEPDQQALEMLANKATIAEAKAWLAADPKQHVLWKGDRQAISQLVDSLYAAGAPNVSAADISKEEGFELVALFVVTLPDDPAARAKVFKTHNDFWRTYLTDVDEDELADFQESDRGQKHLTLNFDL